MKVILKNSTLTFTNGIWSETGRIVKVLSSVVESVAFPIGKSCNVMSRNLVDSAHLKYHKILNDSGEEIDDPSSYFDNFIPMFGGGTTNSNIGMVRVYYYDQNKSLIYRALYTASKSIKVPSTYKGIDIYWIKIQTNSNSLDTLNTMIVTKDEETEPESYEAFNSNTDGTIYAPYSWVYADDLSEITITKR